MSCLCWCVYLSGNWQFLELWLCGIRMEVLNYRNLSFLAKTAGTLVSIAGAFVVTLYKGPEILNTQSSPKLNYNFIGTPQMSWIIGGLFLVADCAVSSGYIIVQVHLYRWQWRNRIKTTSYRENDVKENFLEKITVYDLFLRILRLMLLILLLQASILKKYPAELIIVFFYCFFASILSTFVSLVTDPDLSAWALQPNIRLIAVLYSVCE